VEKHILWSGK